MNSISARLFSDIRLGRPTSLGVASIVVPLVAGSMLAVLVLLVGPVTAPLFLALLFLPWFLKDPFRLFIWLILSWPLLSLYARIPLPVGIPDISYERVLTLILVAVLVVEGLQLKRRLRPISVLDILILLYVAAQLGARAHVVWFGGTGNPDLNGFLDVLLIPLMLYWAAKNLIVSQRQLQWLLYALVIASVIVCATGLYEQAVGARVFKVSAAMGGSEASYQWRDPQSGLRAAGALANPAVYGAVLGMGALAAICCLTLTKNKLLQAAFLAATAVLLYGVFASYTRSAWLSVLAVLLIAQFFIRGIWKTTLPILITLGLIIAILWGALPENANFVARALNTKTIDQRVGLFDIGWQRFLEKPFTGWGTEALNQFAMLGEGITSHNVYLTLLVDGGIVLLLTFLAVAVYILFRSVRTYLLSEKGSLDRLVLVAMTGNVLIFLLSALSLELRYFAYLNALFWISAGIIDQIGSRVRA